MWLLKQHFTGSVEVAIKYRVAVPNFASTGHDRALRTYYKSVNFLLKRYATDDNVTILDN